MPRDATLQQLIKYEVATNPQTYGHRDCLHAAVGNITTNVGNNANNFIRVNTTKFITMDPEQPTCYILCGGCCSVVSMSTYDRFHAGKCKRDDCRKERNKTLLEAVKVVRSTQIDGADDDKQIDDVLIFGEEKMRDGFVGDDEKMKVEDDSGVKDNGNNNVSAAAEKKESKEKVENSMPSSATTIKANETSIPAATTKPQPPVVVIIQDSYGTDNNNGEVHKKKRAKTTSSSKSTNQEQEPILFHPDSNNLLDAMLHPLPKTDFLKNHFRKNAVHVQRGRRIPHGRTVSAEVSDICDNYLYGLDVRQIFEESSSENVFLWLRPPPASADTPPTATGSTKAAAVNSVEISDPQTAYALHTSGSHPAYCRAPPLLEQHLVGSLLRATGLGGGHYHAPHEGDVVTLGGGTSLGRGEVELFIGAGAGDSKRSNGNASGEKKHTTGWHTDFQENFTIQLSGIKRWTLRRGRVRHPLRGTTPHYARDASVVENQLKVARLSCLGGDNATSSPGLGLESNDGLDGDGSYGFEYGENNTVGEEQAVTLYPGDVFYFPSGMWHKVETIEPGVSLNVSLMGTTYANLVGEAMQHLLVGSDEGWREVVTCRPHEDENGESSNSRLEGLLGGLSQLVDNFVTKQGGAKSLLPPALCRPPLGQEEESEDGSEDGIDDDCDSNEGDENSGPMDEQMEEGGDNEDEGNDDDPPTSGIIISIDDFEGPPSWAWRPQTPGQVKLVKNPLSSLIAMSEITKAIGQQPQEGDKQEKEVTKQYLLNVNFAGNEMMESHVRVIFETSNPDTIEKMGEYLECEAQGLNPGTYMRYNRENENGIRIHPPLCLFYYGYFSWNCTG